MIHIQRFGLVLAASLLANAALISAAPAQTPGHKVDETLPDEVGGRVRGTIRVHRDRTNWDLTVSNLRKDGKPVYAEIRVDLSARPDKVFRSGNATGDKKSVRWTGDTKHDGTRGAILFIFRDIPHFPDDGGQVLYLQEK